MQKSKKFRNFWRKKIKFNASQFSVWTTWNFQQFRARNPILFTLSNFSLLTFSSLHLLRQNFSRQTLVTHCSPYPNSKAGYPTNSDKTAVAFCMNGVSESWISNDNLTIESKDKLTIDSKDKLTIETPAGLQPNMTKEATSNWRRRVCLWTIFVLFTLSEEIYISQFANAKKINSHIFMPGEANLVGLHFISRNVQVAMRHWNDYL